jgi:glucosamine kinase
MGRAGPGPSHLDAARRHPHPYRSAVLVSDAQAACVGAHDGRDGGIIVIGTGTIGWAELDGRQYRVGGWGWPISDEGSGAWLGCEALRRTLWAHDGRIAWTPLLRSLLARFRSDPQAIVRWMTGAVEQLHGGSGGDPAAARCMPKPAQHRKGAVGRHLVRNSTFP